MPPQRHLVCGPTQHGALLQQAGAEGETCQTPFDLEHCTETSQGSLLDQESESESTGALMALSILESWSHTDDQGLTVEWIEGWM